MNRKWEGKSDNCRRGSEPRQRRRRTGTPTPNLRPKKGSVAANAAQKYAGRADLAARVRHVAIEEGDGAGLRWGAESPSGLPGW